MEKVHIQNIKKHGKSMIAALLLFALILAGTVFSGYAGAVLAEDLSGAALTNSGNDWSVDLMTGEITGTAPEGRWIDEGNYDVSWYNETDDEFEIDTAAELAGFAYILISEENFFENKTVRLSADIDMSAHQWVCNNLLFSGILDGQGHTINGIFFFTDFVDSWAIGFISYLDGGVIQNINLTNTYIKYQYLAYSGSFFAAGAIVGFNNEGRIINCSAQGYVEAFGCLGGIVGYSQQWTEDACIHNNYFVGSLKLAALSEPDIAFETHVGAIAGVVYSETVYNNYAAAYVPSSESYILDAIGHIDRGWYNDIESDVRLNYCFDGEAFVADYDEENEPEDGFISEGVLLSALTEEQLLVLLNKGVDYISEYLDRPETYYPWRISGYENNGFPIFGTLYPPYSVSHFLTNISAPEGSSGEGAATGGTAYTVILTAASGYALPSNIAAKVGGVLLGGEAYAYDPVTGEVTISAGYVAGEIELIATGEVIFYDITYALGGGTNDEGNPSTYTIEDAVTLFDPTKDGYTFDGWTEGNTITAGSTGGKTFTAQWTVIEYDIIYVLDGGTNHAENPASYTIESEAITLHSPIRVGYVFDGFTEGGVVAAGSTGDKTFTARWILTAPVITGTAGYSGTYDETEHSVTVTASHALGDVTYQWYKGSISAENLIAGQTSAALSVREASDSGTYYCRITYTDGQQTKYVDSTAIEVSITETGNNGLSCGAIAGIVTSGIVLVLLAAALYLFVCRRAVIFLVNGKETARIKLRFNEEITVPEEISAYVWFKDKEMTKRFSAEKMKFKSFTLYGEAIKTNYKKEIEKL